MIRLNLVIVVRAWSRPASVPGRYRRARCWRRHGLHDEEEAVQVWGAVLSGGAHGGAFRVCGAVRQGPPARRRELPRTF